MKVFSVRTGLMTLLASAAAAGLLSVNDGARAQTIEELRAELEQKKEGLEDAEARIQKFKEDIQLKRREARTLKDQIVVIDDSIEELTLTIAKTGAEIEKTSSEIKTVVGDIAAKEVEIAHQKEILAEYLRSLYTLKQQSSVTIFLKYATFSEAVTEAATYEELQARSQETLGTIKQLRDELAQKKIDLEEFQKSLEVLRQRQSEQQATLAASRETKERGLNH